MITEYTKTIDVRLIDVVLKLRMRQLDMSVCYLRYLRITVRVFIRVGVFIRIRVSVRIRVNVRVRVRIRF